jgi:hypothetical protein
MSWVARRRSFPRSSLHYVFQQRLLVRLVFERAVQIKGGGSVRIH